MMEGIWGLLVLFQKILNNPVPIFLIVASEICAHSKLDHSRTICMSTCQSRHKLRLQQNRCNNQLSKSTSAERDALHCAWCIQEQWELTQKQTIKNIQKSHTNLKTWKLIWEQLVASNSRLFVNPTCRHFNCNRWRLEAKCPTEKNGKQKALNRLLWASMTSH